MSASWNGGLGGSHSMPDPVPQPAHHSTEQKHLHAFLDSDVADLRAPPAPTLCEAHEFDLYAAVMKKAERHAGLSPVVSVHTIPSRRSISHLEQWSESVPVVCRGWATSSVALPDGRRQILSFVLPGDFACTASLFEPISGRLIQTITEVTYCNIKRSELKDFVFATADLLEILTRTWSAERTRREQL